MKKSIVLIITFLILLTFSGCGIDPDPAFLEVSFDSNGGSSVEKISNVEYGSKITKPKDPAYAGYTFKGWYKDDNTDSKLWDWESDTVTENLILYAKWEKNKEGMFEVSFESRGGSSVEKIRDIKFNTKILKPDKTPEYAGYTFVAWYKNEEAVLEPWDWENDTVTENITLYAKWLKKSAQTSTYVFEAEDSDLRQLTGAIPGFDWPIDVIYQKENVDANGGRFVSGLYGFGRSLDFRLFCGDNVDDAILVARFSAEIRDIVLSSDVFAIVLNGTVIKYEPISLTGVPASGEDFACLPFKDFIIGTHLSLKKGKNLIRLITTNDSRLNGTTIMSEAPLVDCIKITASTEISWDGNYGLPKKNY